MTDSSGKQTGETRKLQITGGSTYILSLPKKWILRNQLRKGSSLSLREEEDGSLSITASPLVKHEKPDEAFIRVASNDNSSAVIRKAVSAYLVGYDVLHIEAQDQQELSSRLRNELMTFARRFLVGTEIVTDTTAELVLQVLLSYPELTVQSALRRMSIITLSMHKDAIAALKKLDYQAAKVVIDTDTEVDRFNLYIIRLLKSAISDPRIIKEIGLDNARDCLGYRLITKSVERTADHATSIAENVLILRKRLSEEALEKIERMSSIAVTMFEEAMESLFRGNFNMAEGVVEKIKEVKKIEKDTLAARHEAGVDEIASLRLMIESIKRTAEYAADIAEIVLNLNIESVLS